MKKVFLCFIYIINLFVFILPLTSCQNENFETVKIYEIENDDNYLNSIGSYKDENNFRYNILHRGIIKNYLINMKAKVNSSSGNQKYTYEKEDVNEYYSFFESVNSIYESTSFKNEISAGLKVDIYGIAEASLISTIGSEMKYETSYSIYEYLENKKKTQIKEKYEFEFNNKNKFDGFFVIGLFCDVDVYSVVVDKFDSYSILDYYIPQNIVLSSIYVGNESINKPLVFKFSEIEISKIKQDNNITDIKSIIESDFIYEQTQMKIDYGKNEIFTFDISKIDLYQYKLLGFNKMNMDISYYLKSDSHLLNWGTKAIVSIKIDENEIYKRNHSIQSSSSTIFSQEKIEIDLAEIEDFNYIINEITCNDDFVSCFISEYKIRIKFC